MTEPIPLTLQERLLCHELATHFPSGVVTHDTPALTALAQRTRLSQAAVLETCAALTVSGVLSCTQSSDDGYGLRYRVMLPDPVAFPASLLANAAPLLDDHTQSIIYAAGRYWHMQENREDVFPVEPGEAILFQPRPTPGFQKSSESPWIWICPPL